MEGDTTISTIYFIILIYTKLLDNHNSESYYLCFIFTNRFQICCYYYYYYYYRRMYMSRFYCIQYIFFNNKYLDKVLKYSLNDDRNFITKVQVV